MSGFPLFRLPLLPLKLVFDRMYPCDLLMLYLCSEKSQNVIKVTKKSVSIDSLSSEQKEQLSVVDKMGLLKLEIQSNPDGSFGCFPEDSVNMNITITHGLEIKIDSAHSHNEKFNGYFPLFTEVLPINSLLGCTGTKSSLKIGDIFVPVKVMDNRRMFTFWKDPGNGFSIFLNYIQKFFNTKILKCCIHGSNDSKFSKHLRAVVKGIGQKTIDNCEILDSFNSEDYKFILDNIKPTILFKQFHHSGIMSDDFRHKTSFNSKCLFLSHAKWFTFDNLITTHCESIGLGKSILTNDDLCEYLKLWMDGKFEKLKSLTVELQEKPDMAYIFSKLNGYSQIYTLFQEEYIIDIKRQNETVATISIIIGYTTTNNFQFSILNFT